MPSTTQLSASKALSGVVKDRIRLSQVLFREVNQQIAEITRTNHELVSEFLCECGRPDCATVLELELTEYEEIRTEEGHFIAAPDHCVEGVDRKVEERQGFEVLLQV